MATSPSPQNAEPVRLVAVGDLLLAGPGKAPLRDLGPGLARRLTDADIVLGNLECTLPGTGATVPTEPRVVATPDAVRAVVRWGFDVLCLANNHMFDHLVDGFRAVRRLLDELGVAWFGAGENLAEATRPAVLEVRGRRLAFIGAADHRSGPARFATAEGFGVAPLEVERLIEQIRRLRREVHHVIVSLHWGEERFLIPSPLQVEQARALAEAGASVVLGHHPHVVQGLEVHRGVPILYSLGNFVACEVPFSDGDRLTWNRLERTGCLLTVDLTREGAAGVIQTPTFDSGRTVEVDASGFGDRRIARANRVLARGVTRSRYRLEHLWVKTLRPALAHLRWSELKRLRLSQVRRAVANLFGALRAE